MKQACLAHMAGLACALQEVVHAAQMLPEVAAAVGGVLRAVGEQVGL
jgi:hypothetical protein